MIVITYKKNKQIEIPNSWEELTVEQYLNVSSLLFEFYSSKSNLNDFRISVLKKIINYKRSKKRISKDSQEQIDSNLYLLSEQMRFPVKPSYKDPELLTVLDPELQKRLSEVFPFEIYDPEFLPELEMVRTRLEYLPVINFNMKRNLLPEFKLNGINYYGPVFNIDINNVVETDIKALEFVDAYSYYKMFIETSDIQYLRNLTAILYRQNRDKYSTFDSQISSKNFHELDLSILQAVFLLFENTRVYITELSPYKLIFSGTNKDEEKLNLGIGDTIYNLSKAGYGSLQDVENMVLSDYLNLLMKQIIDSVRNMRDMKMKDHEIADKLEIPLETIILI